MCPYIVMTRQKSTMSMELYRKIIDDASLMSMTDVCLNLYGEPLLDKFLFERVIYAKSKGMRVGFHTNGTLLLKGEYVRQILDSYLDWIGFSVDSVAKESYEKIRMGANFEEVVEGITKFIGEKKKSNATKPEVQISCCVQAANYAEINTEKNKFYEVFKGADVFAFAPVMKRGAEGEHIVELLPRDLDFRTPVKIRGHTYPCFGLFDNITVLVDGSMVLCCMDYDGNVRIGDLNAQSIEDVWNSDQYRKIRRLHLEGRGAEIKMCSDCKELKIASFRWWL